MSRKAFIWYRALILYDLVEKEDKRNTSTTEPPVSAMARRMSNVNRKHIHRYPIHSLRKNAPRVPVLSPILSPENAPLQGALGVGGKLIKSPRQDIRYPSPLSRSYVLTILFLGVSSSLHNTLPLERPLNWSLLCRHGQSARRESANRFRQSL